MKFCADVFCITLTVTMLRGISQGVSLSLGHYAIFFGPIWGILFNVLKNLKHFFDTLHECLDITAVVTKLRNVFGFPLRCAFLGVFGSFCTMFLK